MSLIKLNSKARPSEVVRQLQRDLNSLGRQPALTIDGVFGDRTDNAVRWAQAKLELVVDGIVGNQTRTALRRALAPVAPARKEPDKSAINQPLGHVLPASNDNAAPPQNGVKLFDTARPIKEIIIHCAATPEGRDYTVADIRAWHKARGWNDIGYHYVVYRDGRIMLGRPVGQVGAHVEGHNTGTIGIVYVGGVSADGKIAKDTRTPAQRASLLWLTEQLISKHRGVKKVSGHNQYAAKACPSFDVRKDKLGQLLKAA